MAARRNRMKQNGSSMGALMNPVRGIRDQMRRDGRAPRDHLAANKRALIAKQREVSAATARRTAESSKENFKMKKFKNVPSRLMQGTERKVGGASCTGGAAKKSFLRKKSGATIASPSPSSGYGEEEEESYAAPSRRGGKAAGASFTLSDWAANPSPPGKFERPKIVRFDRPAVAESKPSVPRRTETLSVARPEKRNIIAANRDAARIMRPTSREAQRATGRGGSSTRRRGGNGSGASKMGGGQRHQEYGQVPRYITKRRAENAALEAERRAAMPDPDCPPGTVLMAEEERVAMLEALHKSEAALKLQMHRLPLRIETIGQQRRKKALDEKAKEIEEAIDIFSKEKVYVAA